MKLQETLNKTVIINTFNMYMNYLDMIIVRPYTRYSIVEMNESVRICPLGQNYLIFSFQIMIFRHSGLLPTLER